MNNPPAPRPALPENWSYLDPAVTQGLEAELQRELPPGHLLYGKPVEAFAACDASDDVLFRHSDEPERFTEVHLTWIGKQEINAEHPTVGFDGRFDGWVAYESR